LEGLFEGDRHETEFNFVTIPGTSLSPKEQIYVLSNPIPSAIISTKPLPLANPNCGTKDLILVVILEEIT
jgi:hypothetical protein